MMEMPENAAVWKSHLITGFRAALDFKVMGLLFLNVFILYMGTWDTVIRPGLEQMQGRDVALEGQKKILLEKQGLQNQYKNLEQQLKTLSTELISVPEGNSATVISVTEAAELLEVAKGRLRDVAILPPLLPPHDQRSNVTLTFVTGGTVDLLTSGQPIDATKAASTPALAAEASLPAAASAPGGMPAPAEPVVSGGPPTAAAAPVQIGSATLPVEKYDYDLKVTGTYPALMDVLNELIIRKKLIRINKVAITRPATPEPQPDAKDFPDFPVKLEMVISLSIFLYAPVAS
ncbi:hypothetical protein [Vampirovibrio sp.]|uniref:hypothetical protein n=1 Tax=Vampirovibrio sp. TaxID=2717857 RepID=UPI003594810E